MKKTYFIFLVVIMALSLPVVSQTAVFYLTDSTLLNFNTRIVDIKENLENSEIYLLGKIDNEDFTNVEGPWFGRVDKNAKMIFSKGWYVEGMNDVRNILLLPPNKNKSTAKIYGNIRKGAFFSPYYKVANEKAESPSELVTMNNSSSLLKSVCDIGHDQSYELWSVLGANKLYNLRIKQMNTLTGFQNRIIKVNSNYNEEAVDIKVLQNDSSLIILAKRFDKDMSSSVIYRIGAAGDSIWSKVIDSTENFVSHTICISQNQDTFDEKIVLAFTLGDSRTKLISFDKDGYATKKTVLSDIELNGILALKDILVAYGYKTDTIKNGLINTIVKHAAIAVLDNELNILKYDKLTVDDKPDIDVQGIVPRPCSTEIFCATALSDGRIALGGRALMPKDCSANGYASNFTNRPLLIMLDKNLNLKQLINR